MGSIDLRVPRDREGKFSTELFERYQRSEKALLAALSEMYVQGVSTRKIKAVTEELCGHEFSTSTTSNIHKTLDPQWEAFADAWRRGSRLTKPKRRGIRHGLFVQFSVHNPKDFIMTVFYLIKGAPLFRRAPHSFYIG